MGTFRLPSLPSTEQKTLRFPIDVIEAVENRLVGTESNFTAFVIASTRWALENLKEQDLENCVIEIEETTKKTEYLIIKNELNKSQRKQEELKSKIAQLKLEIEDIKKSYFTED